MQEIMLSEIVQYSIIQLLLKQLRLVLVERTEKPPLVAFLLAVCSLFLTLHWQHLIVAVSMVTGDEV